MNKMLRKSAVEDATGYKIWSIYKFVREGSFPAPYKLGKRAVAWKESEVQEWIDARHSAR